MLYKPVVLVGGIVHKNGKILLLKRLDSKKFFPGHWEMPGGKLNEGENPAEAIIRETKEETGFDVSIKQVYNTWADTILNNETKEHVIEIDFILNLKDAQDVRLSEKEHSAYKWVGKGELPKPITPQMHRTLELAFNYL